MSDSDKIRAEFEAWAKANSHFDLNRVNNPNSIFHTQYRIVVTDIVWRMYQDAYASGRKAAEAVGCVDGCMIKRAVKEFTEGMSNDY